MSREQIKGIANQTGNTLENDKSKGLPKLRAGRR